ncbi:hypothetical protein DM02DRAFT_598048 [Periconia macrospinosa]|uniref:Dipeptidase n=1 Tax=Periconia macrospinosa TaxID=97972 RepID=A0A2V1DJ85_9PLEO|nr:hypothetical protein DM02DRAFT_598048 [Periconia macrospinosa]
MNMNDTIEEAPRVNEKTSIFPHAASKRHRASRNRVLPVIALCLLGLFATLTTRPLPQSLCRYYGHRGCLEEPIALQARRILEQNPLIDGHNDLLITIRGTYKNHIYSEDFKQKFEHGGFVSHVDLPRLDAGLQGGAFWSAFMPCPTSKNGTDFSDSQYAPIVRSTLDALDLFHRLGAQYPKYFTPTPSHSTALEAFAAGRLISPVIIEGLHQIGNSIANLRLFHRLGVRYATLTWNCHNKYADAALESDEHFNARIATPYWHGLSKDGRKLVHEMNRLGMIVDLAHVSVDTMRDALIGSSSSSEDDDWKGSLAPPIFSHSSVHAICPHPRNVPDHILHLLPQRASLIMINISPSFISCVLPPDADPTTTLPNPDPEHSTLEQVVKHIMYVGQLIGYDYVGIGTDFDGIEDTPKGLEDVSKFPDLVAELLRKGVSEVDVVKVIGGNLLRVWSEVDRVRDTLKDEDPLEDEIENSWA